MSKRSLVALLLLIASLGSEVFAVSALAGPAQSMGLLGFLAFHLGAAAMAAESLRLSSLESGFGGSRSLAATAAFLTLAFPGIGSAVVVYLAYFRPSGRRGYAGKASLQTQRAEAAQEAQERKRAAQLVEGSVRSVADALKDRSKDVRIAAVESLRGDVSKKAVQFLEQSQMNTVYDVRVRAIDNLNTIRDQCRQKLRDSRGQLQQRGGDLNLLFDHAILCKETAELGIEDTATSHDLYREARACTAQISTQWPDASEVHFISASVLRALGRYQEAEHEYAAILRSEPTNSEAILGLAEVQFQSRDFSSLRMTCRQLVRAKTGDLDAELTQVLRMWLHGVEGHAQG